MTYLLNHTNWLELQDVLLNVVHILIQLQSTIMVQSQLVVETSLTLIKTMYQEMLLSKTVFQMFITMEGDLLAMFSHLSCQLQTVDTAMKQVWSTWAILGVHLIAVMTTTTQVKVDIMSSTTMEQLSE